jgi:hypothetical protein
MEEGRKEWDQTSNNKSRYVVTGAEVARARARAQAQTGKNKPNPRQVQAVTTSRESRNRSSPRSLNTTLGCLGCLPGLTRSLMQFSGPLR